MTEVRPLQQLQLQLQPQQQQQQQQYGLYATKDYDIGDCILIESVPLIQLSPTVNNKYEQEWMNEMMKTTTTNHPTKNKQDDGENDSKMMTMVQVTLCFVLYISSKYNQHNQHNHNHNNQPQEEQAYELELDPVICELRQLYRPATAMVVTSTSPTTTTTTTTTVTKSETEEQSIQLQRLRTLSQQAVDYVESKLVSFIFAIDGYTVNHTTTTTKVTNKNDSNDQQNDSSYSIWVTQLRTVIQKVLFAPPDTTPTPTTATTTTDTDTTNETTTGSVVPSPPPQTLVLSPTVHVIVQEILLVWAGNAFDGGRIYRTFSRINHHCNPNAVVVVDDDAAGKNTIESNHRNDAVGGSRNDTSSSNNQQYSKQSLMVARKISSGDEICISYLHGPFIYADTNTRQQILLQDKYFNCTCTRCSTSQHPTVDVSSAIPCFQCHPREVSQTTTTTTTNSNIAVLLSEDVQYDDDHTVRYMYPNGNDIYYCNNCPSSSSSLMRMGSNQLQHYNKIYSTNQTIIEKVVAFLRQRRPDIISSRPERDEGGEEEEKEQELIYVEQLEQFLRMASSILGAKHWTTNMLLLYQLNDALTTFHTRSILKLTSSQNNSKNTTNQEYDDDDDDDIETTIAEAIDMLQRVERFVVGVTSLQLHMGHLLSDVMIGIARALVSLGDVKSQRYAAQWMDKIAVYVNQFESSGKQAVVQSLQTAWQRTGNDTTSNNETNRPTAKRSKR